MPTRKQEKRRRKLRVHGPSADAVGAPPTGRKPPREDAPAARTQRSGRRERSCRANSQRKRWTGLDPNSRMSRGSLR